MNKRALDYNDPELPSRNEIKQDLLARLPEVLSHLFPNGKHLKREFQVSSLHAATTAKDSLNTRTQQWGVDQLSDYV